MESNDAKIGIGRFKLDWKDFDLIQWVNRSVNRPIRASIPNGGRDGAGGG